MCGLFGIVPGAHCDAKVVRSIFRELAYLNDSRGGHSWGLWGREQDAVHGMGRAHKEGLYALVSVAKLWEPAEGNWLVGHTRYGTHGANVIQNAHPFHAKGAVMDILLAHNGVARVQGYERVHSVDSFQIAQALADEGPSAMRRVSGSCALLISQGSRLMAYRSTQVLSMAYCSAGWIISSEAKHLSRALLDHKLVPAMLQAVTPEAFVAPWDDVVIEAPSANVPEFDDSFGIEQVCPCSVCGVVDKCAPRSNEFGDIEWICTYCYSQVINEVECEECGRAGASYYGRVYGYLCPMCAGQITG